VIEPTVVATEYSTVVSSDCQNAGAVSTFT
jgi:hypothetical protein